MKTGTSHVFDTAAFRRGVAALLGMALLVLPTLGSATTNASGNDDWISIGVPTTNWLGTDGTYYFIGNDQGSCASTAPNYFRVDTTLPKWKELFTLILYAAANQKTFVCKVQSGCGTSEVWVRYCQVSL